MNIRDVAIPRGARARVAWFLSIVLAGAAAGFALGHPLSVYQRSHVRRTTRQAMESLQKDLQSDMQARFFAQIRLADLWSSHVLETEERWDLASRLFLDHHPGYLALEWVDDAYRTLCVAIRQGEPVTGLPPRGTDQILRTLAPTLPATTRGLAVMTPRLALADGRSVVRVVVPVVRVDTVVGYLVATVDVREVLDNMAEDHRGLGYSVSIADGSVEIYRMPGSRPDNETELAAAGDLELPGARWQIRLWPRPELLSDMRSSLPALVMVLGGLFGGVLMLAVHFGRTARRTSIELQGAHDGLEARVRARTTELEEISRTLQTEVADRKRAEDSYRDLSGRLLLLQDEERRRFARDLHDSTAQVLGALAINVDRSLHLARAGELGRLARVLEESGEIVEEVTQEIRTVSHLLHPPMIDDLGMEYALPWYADGFGRRSGIAVTLSIQPDFGRLSRDVELTLFRIVQESLANVHRHSGSASVSIALSRAADEATLVVTDFGTGIPKAALDAFTGASTTPIGVGIGGMRGRVSQLNGTLDITSSRQGTTIRAVLPLVEAEVPAGQAAAAGPGVVRVEAT